MSLLLPLVAGACTAACAAEPPPEPPDEEEVRSFLSAVGEAMAAGDEAALRGFFEGGDSYPERDLERLESARFWTLRPASRVARLGPDAFRIRLLPEEQPRGQGPVSVRVNLDLPVRRDGDGRLRILSREETERLEVLPVPDARDGGEVVELEAPEEEGFGWRAGDHYATELRAAAGDDEVCLAIRFDPPLAGPKLRTDRSLSEEHVLGFGEEIRVAMSLDADADGSTGFDMEEHYRSRDGDGAQRVREWESFGTEAKLLVDGVKFVERDGSRTLGLRVKLRRVALERHAPGSWIDRGETFFEKTLEDPEVAVESGTLTVRVPAAVLPIRAGAAYRVMLEQNGRTSLKSKARKGVAGAGGCPSAPEA